MHLGRRGLTASEVAFTRRTSVCLSVRLNAVSDNLKTFSSEILITPRNHLNPSLLQVLKGQKEKCCSEAYVGYVTARDSGVLETIYFPKHGVA